MHADARGSEKGMHILRYEPIDFADIAQQSGLRRGKLCKTSFGWGVQNTHGDHGAGVALIVPPAMQAGETELRIEDGQWCFYG